MLLHSQENILTLEFLFFCQSYSDSKEDVPSEQEEVKESQEEVKESPKKGDRKEKSSKRPESKLDKKTQKLIADLKRCKIQMGEAKKAIQRPPV